jgi:hypothetical protein
MQDAVTLQLLLPAERHSWLVYGQQQQHSHCHSLDDFRCAVNAAAAILISGAAERPAGVARHRVGHLTEALDEPADAFGSKVKLAPTTTRKYRNFVLRSGLHRPCHGIALTRLRIAMCVVPCCRP